jgi:hypothetical protein
MHPFFAFAADLVQYYWQYLSGQMPGSNNPLPLAQGAGSGNRDF